MRCTEHGIDHDNRECPVCELEGVVVLLSNRLKKLEDYRLPGRLVILEQIEAGRQGDR